MVYNKIDKYECFEPRIERDQDGLPKRVWLSAKTGEGIEYLRQALQEYFPEPSLEAEFID
jgi:GTP-binding protein HflX